MKIVYLKPKSTFPILSSDSIFGALVYAVSEIYPDKLDDFLQKFKNKENIPFLISSAFPYIKYNNNYLRFYPKPMTKLQPSPINKDFKKINFIEENIFLELIRGNITNQKLFDKWKNKDFLQSKNKKFLIKKDKENILEESFISKEITPHNVIDRIKNNSNNIFYSENYRFMENKGLFFLVNFIDNEYENIFISLLKFLKDRGFGKDISTGNGHFDFEINDFNLFDDINNSEKGQYFVSLSRFIPDNNDLTNINKLNKLDNKINMLYEFGNKRSRDSFGLRKQTKFFKEASIFPFYSKYCGCLVDTSNHSVEYGYSFNIRYNLEEL